MDASMDISKEIHVLKDSAIMLKAWIGHWRDDAACRLPCTSESLSAAMLRVEDSLSAIKRIQEKAA